MTKIYPGGNPVQCKSCFKLDTISCVIPYVHNTMCFFEDLTWLPISQAHNVLKSSISVNWNGAYAFCS